MEREEAKTAGTGREEGRKRVEWQGSQKGPGREKSSPEQAATAMTIRMLLDDGGPHAQAQGIHEKT
jgi:hypothetical protein